MPWKRNYGKCFSLNGLTKPTPLQGGDGLVPSQNEVHHQDDVSHTSSVPQVKFLDSIMGSIFPRLLQRLTPLFNGPKLSFKATAGSLPSQITSWPPACCQSHTKVGPSLQVNPGCTGPSSAPVQSLPALAFATLQNPQAPPGFKMALRKT